MKWEHRFSAGLNFESKRNFLAYFCFNFGICPQTSLCNTITLSLLFCYVFSLVVHAFFQQFIVTEHTQCCGKIDSKVRHSSYFLRPQHCCHMSKVPMNGWSDTVFRKVRKSIPTSSLVKLTIALGFS